MQTIYVITHDGKPIGICESNEATGALPWFAQNVKSYSMAHAIDHEGYGVEEGEPDCADVSDIIAGIAARVGLEMSAVFVPWSVSRMRNEKHCSLNWDIAFSRKSGGRFTVQYTQGHGHAPASNIPESRCTPGDRRLMVAHECETGKKARSVMHSGKIFSGKALPAPHIGDVLHSVILDSSVLDAGCFEDWAEGYGLSADSREAERTYRECIDTALAVRSVISQRVMNEMTIAARFN